ncbi:MAG: hypothetical protein V4530_08055 [Pseudomonadota bacterium]
MSSRQLEEMQEAKLDAWVASETGFSPEELEGHSLDDNTSDDGFLYGYIVTLADGRTASIGIPPEEPDHND